ncbi:phage tail assembly chaperone [Vibrio coralliilyticus]|uniref:phage tail assembly chaperone n=1 Tax=Vibrio coralliilyticus TaxID=190893 RepID=UPI000C167FA6|nr:phage tail assembly chaperone [Vibrio coralliilyticus]
METQSFAYNESDQVTQTRWAEVRAIRDAKLSGADALMNRAVDNGLDTTAISQYRQALRDIPQTYNQPDDVVWPQKPSLPQASS